MEDNKVTEENKDSNADGKEAPGFQDSIPQSESSSGGEPLSGISPYDSDWTDDTDYDEPSDLKSLSERCERKVIQLFMMAALSAFALIILAVGIFGICMAPPGTGHAGVVLIFFVILLLVIHGCSVPLTGSSERLFNRIGDVFPDAASRARYSAKLTSRAGLFCIIFLMLDILTAVSFPVIVPLIGTFVAFRILSVFAIDGRTGEPWGGDGFGDGILSTLSVVSVFLAVIAVAVAVLHLVCFGYLFLVLNNFIICRDALRRACIFLKTPSGTGK